MRTTQLVTPTTSAQRRRSIRQAAVGKMGARAAHRGYATSMLLKESRCFEYSKSEGGGGRQWASSNGALQTSARSTRPQSQFQMKTVVNMTACTSLPMSNSAIAPRPRQAATHAQILTSLVTKSRHPAAVWMPALSYPEWRNKAVHCARCYCMLEGRRPYCAVPNHSGLCTTTTGGHFIGRTSRRTGLSWT